MPELLGMDPMEALAQALAATPPSGIEQLPADDIRQLAALIEDARERQSVELDEAIHGGLQHIPRPLRRVVRTVLFR